MSALAFYTREGHRFVPTGLGISPWNPQAQMGVGLAGLVVAALDEVPSPVPMLTARLTIDILGAVPIDPLTASVRIVRDGRRIQMVEAELHAGGRAWVRATALRMRLGESPGRATLLTRPLPESSMANGLIPWVDVVRLQGSYDAPGPGACWMRMRAAVLAGEPLSALAGLAMIADFGSGIAPVVPLNAWKFANVDIALHLARPPRGDWLLLDAVADSAGNGIGIVHARLGDCDGMIGMTHQTTFLEPR